MALVITLVVLLIIAGAAVAIAINSGDIFNKAADARNDWNAATVAEEQTINEAMNNLNALTGGNNDEDPVTRDASGANEPVLPTGNITVKYVTWTGSNGTYTESAVTDEPENWHNYNLGQWANIKTESTTEGSNNVAYWVWIPRYAYKVHAMPEAANNSATPPTNPEYEIAWLDGATNIPVDSSVLNGASIVTDTSSGVEIGQWVVHPAFNFRRDTIKRNMGSKISSK